MLYKMRKIQADMKDDELDKMKNHKRSLQSSVKKNPKGEFQID